MFNRYDAERYLLLAGDLPGYDVRLALRSAGAARGEVIGEVTVVRRAGAGRPHRPESRLARARPLGRAAARPALRPDRARRPHHARRLFSTADTDEQQTLQVAHDFRLGSEGLAIGGQLTYAWAQPGPRPARRRHRLAHPVRDAGGELPVHPPPDADAARRGRPRHHRPGHRLQRPSRSTATGCASPSPGSTSTRSASPPAIRATRSPSRVWRLAPQRRAAPGARHARRQRGLRPGARRLPRARRGAADPARGRSDRDRAARRRLRRVSADAAASPSRSALRGQYSARPAVQLRGILGRQLHGRARLRSRRPARRQRHRPPGRAALRQRLFRAAPTSFVVEPYVFFDQAWVWNEDLLFALGRPGAELDRRRRARRLWRPLPARRAARRAARPRRPSRRGAATPRLLVSLTTRLWPWRSR